MSTEVTSPLALTKAASEAAEDSPAMNGEAQSHVSDDVEATGAANLEVPVDSGKTNGTATSIGAHIPDLGLPLSSDEGVIKMVFAKPVPNCAPVSRPSLTHDQSIKYATFLQKVSAWTEIPTGLSQTASRESITDEDRMFMTRQCLLRYLRATKWNVDQSEKRLRDTLSWRREYGIVTHTADYISIEGETGKQVVIGWDINCRPCLYLFPSRQNTERTPRQMQYLVYNLERLVDLMEPGEETCTLLINFNETKKGQGATIAQARETLYILQNHYPERLGRALVSNLPWYIRTFFTLIHPFIDPITREKIKFNEDNKKHVPATQLLLECGGDVEMVYDHSQYWPSLNGLAGKRRAEYRRRWEKGGKRIGENEDYLRGGKDAKSLSESQAGEKGTVTLGEGKDVGADKEKVVEDSTDVKSMPSSGAAETGAA